MRPLKWDFFKKNKKVLSLDFPEITNPTVLFLFFPENHLAIPGEGQRPVHRQGKIRGESQKSRNSNIFYLPFRAKSMCVCPAPNFHRPL